MNRRTFLALAGVIGLWPAPVTRLRAQPAAATRSLLRAPLELAGEWSSLNAAAMRVLQRTRDVCLSGLRLLSDRQPEKLRVDNHTSGPPAIWLHDDPPATAWIIVDIGQRDWSKLAYQFGHELGHVLCNSWERSATPRPPTQWLEEAMVEAFSIRGLGLLAASWETNPPFAGDAAFGNSIRQYRANLIERYTAPMDATLGADVAAWFRVHRATLESGFGIPEGIAVLGVLSLLESDQACVEDLAAVNRWPERTGIPIEDYLKQWAMSCKEIGASGHLPAQLTSLFKLR